MEARCNKYNHDIEDPLDHAVADTVNPSYNPCYFTVQVNCRKEVESMRTNEGHETKKRCDSHDTFEFELASIKKTDEGEVWKSGQGKVPGHLSDLVTQEFQELESSYDNDRLGGELLAGVEGNAYRTLIVDSEGDEYEFLFPMSRSR